MEGYAVEYGKGNAVKLIEFDTKKEAEKFANSIRYKYDFVNVFAPGCNIAYLRL